MVLNFLRLYPMRHIHGWKHPGSVAAHGGRVKS
jgi:hypothetical protein